eukprot:1949486-Rhodomonas_salina.1
MAVPLTTSGMDSRGTIHCVSTERILCQYRSFGEQHATPSQRSRAFCTCTTALTTNRMPKTNSIRTNLRSNETNNPHDVHEHRKPECVWGVPALEKEEGGHDDEEDGSGHAEKHSVVHLQIPDTNPTVQYKPDKQFAGSHLVSRCSAKIEPRVCRLSHVILQGSPCR